MMTKRRRYTWIGLTLLGVGLVIGFLEILERRFAEGGVYPHYASFRSDPLGTSVLYESLEGIESLAVSRNQIHLNRVSGLDSETVLLLLGYPRDGLAGLRVPEGSPVIDAVEEGARLVITFNPGLVPEKFRPITTEEEEDWFERRRKLREARDQVKNRRDEGEDDEETGKGEGEEETGKGEGEESEEDKSEEDKSEEDKEKEEEEAFELEMDEAIGTRFTKKFGFELVSLEEFDRPEEGWEVERASEASEAALPGAFPNWFSQFRFEPEADEWTVVAEAEGKPVIIERSVGKGSLVLASDSYFVSNEALHRDAFPAVLLWLLGAKTTVVFDETIHGVEESGGAMKLMRRYRVHGIFFGLLVVVVLWAWRSGSTLAPGSVEIERGLVTGANQVSGKATGAGLTRLLRRSVPASDLFRTCHEIWSESHLRVPSDRRQEGEKILQRHTDDPKRYSALDAYRDMMDALRKR